jgi:Protein of unknown function (DUF1579)
MRCFAVVVAVVSMSVVGAIAQKQEMPKPGPEHQRLGAFVGNWTLEGELKPGPMGPGGMMTATDRIEWAPGNFFVQRSYQAKSPNGEMQGLEILAYDGVKKIYTFNAFDSLGNMASGTMTVKGNTWTSTGTMTMAATTMRDRCSLEFGAGGSTLTMKCEISRDGKTWSPTFDGRAKKTKR